MWFIIIYFYLLLLEVTGSFIIGEKMYFEVQLIHKDAKVPTKNYDNDLGWDLYCVEDKKFQPENYLHHNKEDKKLQYTLYTGERHLFSTGIQIACPEGYGCFIKDRSGNASERGLHVIAGIIDPGYIGPIKVCIVSLSSLPQTINPGDKIAQLIFIPLLNIKPKVVDELMKTKRGKQGFGSSGR